MSKLFSNKKILIFGGSGSWGNELIKQLLQTNVKEIKSYARNEFNQVILKRKFLDNRLKIVLGDIRDYNQVNLACKEIDIIFLLSAVKHVPLAEEFPMEAIKTNILGTENVIQASIVNKVKIVIDSSSDKACAANNLYGMTKAIGEKLILNGSNLSKETKFVAIRSGNVLGTNGSVVPLWIEQIKKCNKITITSKEMTRFFLTLSEAINLLFIAINSNINGGLFVVNMPACKIIDLAEVLIKYYGNKNTKVIETGIRQGEKIHEVLLSEEEAKNAYIYDKNYYVYFADERKTKLKRYPYSKFASNTKLLNKEEIELMLRQGGFIK